MSAIADIAKPAFSAAPGFSTSEKYQGTAALHLAVAIQCADQAFLIFATQPCPPNSATNLPPGRSCAPDSGDHRLPGFSSRQCGVLNTRVKLVIEGKFFPSITARPP